MRRYFKEFRALISKRIICNFITFLTLSAIPYVSKLLIDMDKVALNEKKYAFIFAYIILIVLTLIFNRLGFRAAWKLDSLFTFKVKQDLFKVLTSMPYNDFAAKSKGEYIKVFQNDVPYVESKYIDSTLQIIEMTLQILIYSFFVFLLDFRILIILLIATVVGLLLPNITGKRLAKERKHYHDAISLHLERLENYLDGAKLFKSDTRDNIKKQYEGVVAEAEDKKYNYGKYSTFTTIINLAFGNITNVIIYIVLIFLLVNGQVTAGVVTGSIMYAGLYIGPFRSLIHFINDKKSAQHSIDNIQEILDKSLEELPKVATFQDKIVLKDIRKTYDDFTFGNFSYEFEKGKKYALLGKNGTGKSTLIDIIMGNIQPDQGSVSIDGCDSKSFNFDNVIASYNQNGHLFKDSIYNNITVFDSFDIRKVEEIDILYPHVQALFKEKNVLELSEGQKQFICFLRVLCQDKPIIIMDEMTSAMDDHYKQLVNQVIRTIDKTFVVITHDLSNDSLDVFDQTITL